MTKEMLFDAIAETIMAFDDCSAVSLWNEYCYAVNRFDDIIESMDNLPDLFDTSNAESLFNILNRFYFGHDENDEHSSANPNREWFYFNGYGNIVTTDYPADAIDENELAEWILENKNALYCDEIAELLEQWECEES